MGRNKIYAYMTVSKIRECPNNFNWEDLFNYEPEIDTDIDFLREFRDIIDWEAMLNYYHLTDEKLIKEFLDYLPNIYRENYEDHLK